GWRCCLKKIGSAWRGWRHRRGGPRRHPRRAQSSAARSWRRAGGRRGLFTVEDRSVKDNALASKISDFFTDPAVDPPVLGTPSILHLLRRDVNFCFGIDHTTGQPDPNLRRAIFPGIMAIMAGWDMLGKFCFGSDKPNQAGMRFQAFVRRYTRTERGYPLAKEQVWCLWQLRHSMLHSFGLLARPLDRGRPRRYRAIHALSQCHGYHCCRRDGGWSGRLDRYCRLLETPATV